MKSCVCVVVDTDVSRVTVLFAENVSDLCVAHACASVLVSVYMHCVCVCVCVSVRTMLERFSEAT